ISSIELLGSDGRLVDQVLAGKSMSIRLHCTAQDDGAETDTVALSCWSAEGIKVFHVDNEMPGHPLKRHGRQQAFTCHLPNVRLAPGAYTLNAMLLSEGEILDHIYSAVAFDVTPSDVYGTGRPTPAVGGLVFVENGWE